MIAANAYLKWRQVETNNTDFLGPQPLKNDAFQAGNLSVRNFVYVQANFEDMYLEIPNQMQTKINHRLVLSSAEDLLLSRASSSMR